MKYDIFNGFQKHKINYFGEEGSVFCSRLTAGLLSLVVIFFRRLRIYELFTLQILTIESQT